VSAGWGRSTARGSRRTPAWKSGLDVHESSQVKKSLAQMRGQPDEVAVHGVHRIVHREGGLAGQVADPVLVHEAVFGGHGMFLIGRWDNTSRAAWTPGSRLIRRGSSFSQVQGIARSFEVGVAPGDSRIASVQHNVHYPTWAIGAKLAWARSTHGLHSGPRVGTSPELVRRLLAGNTFGW
jgi:hypothetical protein